MANILGVIGGSGIYDIPGLSEIEELDVNTPFGSPSGRVVRGRLGDTTLLFLPRHGRGHRYPPHQVNYRANICALKLLGAEQLLSLSAVGSMKEGIVPGHVVIVDQFIDLTKHRTSTFFEGDIVAHVGFADPVCANLSAALAQSALRTGATTHQGGVYVCMEGPQFSTRAESRLYRSWGVSVIGMTAMPEAKLAREAELPYAILALATDYDCWHESEEDVTIEAVVEVMQRNSALAKRVVADLATSLPDPKQSPAATALKNAIMTQPSLIGPETRERLGWLVNRYLPQS